MFHKTKTQKKSKFGGILKKTLHGSVTLGFSNWNNYVNKLIFAQKLKTAIKFGGGKVENSFSVLFLVLHSHVCFSKCQYLGTNNKMYPYFFLILSL